MTGLTVVDFEGSMLDEMMQLFYETVHTIGAQDYNKKQLERWAPETPDIISWNQRISNNICKVAFFDDVMAGFSEITSDGHIDTMYVSKDFQRRGVASALLTDLISIAKEKKFQLLTTEASITAKPFFEKYDFEVTRVKTKLYNGEAFINYEMTKHL